MMKYQDCSLVFTDGTWDCVKLINMFFALCFTVFTCDCVKVIYTDCPRRKGPNFGRVFLRSNCTDITKNTYIQSSMVTEILAREF